MKIVLRACAAPLHPGHLAIFLRDAAGYGMSINDAPGVDKQYHDVAIDALEDDAAKSKDFAYAVKDMVYGPTNKAIFKMSARNQFLALAPRLDFASVMTKTDGSILRPTDDELSVLIVKDGEKPISATFIDETLGAMISRPFVMGFDSLAPMETLREAGGLFAHVKLRGFVEQHLGAACVFTYDA